MIWDNWGMKVHYRQQACMNALISSVCLTLETVLPWVPYSSMY